MSTQVPTAFQQKFRDDFWMLSQQKASRLKSAVRYEMVDGEFTFFDAIGAVELVERTSRHGDTPFTEVPNSRRRVNQVDYEGSELIDAQDVKRMGRTPQPWYLKAFAAGAGRAMDRAIINAGLGTAQTDKTGSTAVVFPTGTNQIAVNLSGANERLTINKLLAAKEILDSGEAGVDPDEERFLICPARALTGLLKTTQATSADFNTVQALVHGKIDSFLGFNFIRTQLTLTDGSGNDRCMAWVKSGILLAVQEDFTTKFAEDPTKSFSERIYVRMSVGAVRMEEAKVVDILSHPTA